MNPGPVAGIIAVVASYAVVIGALAVFVTMIASREKRLEKRRRQLKEGM